MIVGLGISRPGVFGGDPLDSPPEFLLGLLEHTAFVVMDTQYCVGAGISWVSSEGLLVVSVRVHTRVVNLLEAQAGQVKLLDFFDSLGGRRSLYNLRQLGLRLSFSRLITNQRLVGG